MKVVEQSTSTVNQHANLHLLRNGSNSQLTNEEAQKLVNGLSNEKDTVEVINDDFTRFATHKTEIKSNLINRSETGQGDLEKGKVPSANGYKKEKSDSTESTLKHGKSGNISNNLILAVHSNSETSPYKSLLNGDLGKYSSQRNDKSNTINGDALPHEIVLNHRNSRNNSPSHTNGFETENSFSAPNVSKNLVKIGRNAEQSIVNGYGSEIKSEPFDLKSNGIPDRNGDCAFLTNENKLLNDKKNLELSAKTEKLDANLSDRSFVNGDLKTRESKVSENVQEKTVANGKQKHLSEEEDWDKALADVKEAALSKLQDELKKAHQELKLRDEEVSRLSRIRQEVETELEELTASLFQEAHNMVRDANVKQAAAEKALKESQMKVEVLMAEVTALKTLVLTSTPSRPNPHLHPQIDNKGSSLFNKKHRRSPSHFNLKYGRENSPPNSPIKEPTPAIPLEYKDGLEVDPNVHREFVAWKANPCMDCSNEFIARIYREDIDLCLTFNNVELGEKVREAVQTGNIFIEAVSDKTKTIFPKKCALLDIPRQCHYRMKLGDQEQWHSISQICRNRIIAVCELLNYLRYIERGLVKSSVHEVYWEITRLRKEMVLARLGLTIAS